MIIDLNDPKCDPKELFRRFVNRYSANYTRQAGYKTSFNCQEIYGWYCNDYEVKIIQTYDLTNEITDLLDILFKTWISLNWIITCETCYGTPCYGTRWMINPIHKTLYEEKMPFD